MWLRREYQDEADGGDGGSGGGGTGADPGTGDDGAGHAPDPMKAIEAVSSQVNILSKAMQLMAQGQAEGQTRMQQLMEAIKEGGGRSREPERKVDANAPLFDGVDIEQMDRAQFGTLLLSKFMERLDSHMDGKLKPLTDKIGSVESTLTRDLGTRSVQEASANNKDLYEWKDEISTLLKEAPNLSLPRALAIARSENPTKAKEMAKKYSGGDGVVKGQKYLSLTPTSRTGGSDEKGGKMKFHDAAERAFDDLVAEFGGSSFEQLTGRH